MRTTHELPPIYDGNSRVLILGTMPSPRSKQEGFYYAHPQNRFWKTLSAVFEEDISPDTASRTRFLYRHHIALWDVIESCEISGAQDSSIREPQATDVGWLMKQAPIQTIFTTGKTALKWYDRLLREQVGLEAVALPSSSPANCAVRMEKMIEEYSKIRRALL